MGKLNQNRHIRLKKPPEFGYVLQIWQLTEHGAESALQALAEGEAAAG